MPSSDPSPHSLFGIVALAVRKLGMAAIWCVRIILIAALVWLGRHLAEWCFRAIQSGDLEGFIASLSTFAPLAVG